MWKGADQSLGSKKKKNIRLFEEKIIYKDQTEGIMKI